MLVLLFLLLKIWILTGDQCSTAFYAAIDAGICERDAQLVHFWDETVALSVDDAEGVLDSLLAEARWAPKRTANVLVIVPRALQTLTTAEEIVQRKLMTLSRKAQTVNTEPVITKSMIQPVVT